ncbi:MAG TPA: cyclopropane-fatty-acyl-phospholipid synthase family protein [Planctomycetota bacterium]|nr:cyclopropane-fatty-acyl-phospholipid synthase family protein [Planctomycetota bacterium]
MNLSFLTRKLVHALGREIRRGTVHLIDGEHRTTFGASGTGLEATVTVLDARFYDALAFRGTIGLAESYRDGDWSSDDLVALFRIFAQNEGIMNGVEGRLARLATPLHRLRHFLRDNTRRGSKANVAAHYDLGNDLYALFLDESMTYSCAVFEDERTTLEEAQLAKIDRVCRKLRLAPGDRLLEIGTGWGALACHAARHYGCHVTTATISRQQLAYARERVRREGLEDRVQVIERDYRDLQGRFDKLVSIEMVEAVGAARLGAFFAKCSELLEPSGLMLLQAITIREDQYERAKHDSDFIKELIFPGTCLLSVAAIGSHVARSTDMTVCHLEDLTPHYARTLALWRERFLANVEKVKATGKGDDFVRLWDLYLAYCEAGFLERYIRDVQVVLAKPLCGQWDSLPPRSGGRVGVGGRELTPC